ncbi:MAG TPA: prolyl oligopeptidase family serine peptidase, partial [Acidobacteriota bacterium]|nr:prolyl oligopeptidase family serine peptidase [Acidobacteriota bacterium]
MKRVAFVISCLILFNFTITEAQQKYEKPPAEILKVLHAQLPPKPYLSPTRDFLVLEQELNYPSISDLAEPLLTLAGIRVNPKTNAERSYISYSNALTLKRLSDGTETLIDLPKTVRLSAPRWNATGTLFAFRNEAKDSVELWVADVATQKARQIPNVALNPVLRSDYQWMQDQKTLLVKLIPNNRGKKPEPPEIPPGPKIQESTGATAPSSTYEVRDVLKSPHDADLFDYFATSQLALIDTTTGNVTPLGKPNVFGSVSASPNGEYILVEYYHRPYSYLRAYYRFPKEVEVWSKKGELVEKLVSQPLAEQVPIDGVVKGPRDFWWRENRPATLTWAEALDDGDPNKKVPYRDRLMIKAVSEMPSELFKVKQRFENLQWIGTGGLALITDFDRDRLWSQTYILNVDNPSNQPRLLWDLSVDEKYKHPGYPVYKQLPNGEYAIHQDGDSIYLDGYGSSPEGDRPFLDKLNLKTLKTERLFRSDRNCYEYFVAWIDSNSGKFITRHESPNDPPNFFTRTLDASPIKNAASDEAIYKSSSQAITNFPDPAPELRGITKEIVTYKRPDDVPLSFTLYLPSGYKKGTPLPTVLWAYPLDYAESSVAGQIQGTAQEFTTLSKTSELFFLLEGYAVLDYAAMPVVGPPENAYNTFVEQIVANAKAAIDKAVELGVTDPDRVGIGGHSHGALMTANLLAYSDLFRAGIARSGAYNHTMRPFGFQNERRTYWKAPDVYIKLSPVLQADKINEPLLLIHGEIDQNPGTVPMQSEKLFDALRGVGGTVRLVMLPYESHGYIA